MKNQKISCEHIAKTAIDIGETYGETHGFSSKLVIGEALGAALRACSLAMRWREALELPRRTGIWGALKILGKFHEISEKHMKYMMKYLKFKESDFQIGDFEIFWDFRLGTQGIS